MSGTTHTIPAIRLYGDPVLRKKSARVETIDRELTGTVGALLAALEQINGLGLAAPQIGCLRRLCVVNLPALDEKRKEPIVLINPEVRFRDGKVAQDEGCLSFPQVYAEVSRPRRIGITGLDRDGKEIEIEAAELMARVLMHEIDHLDGVLFIDHLSVIKRQLLKKQLKDITRRSREKTGG
ncbi:MAG: peptide deformylase [Candidatus Edwardsbacteria bacterium]|nr:peptide deformylase [Candidatus Edwardsbacteria bacterium]